MEQLSGATGKSKKRPQSDSFEQLVKKLGREQMDFRDLVRTISENDEQFDRYWNGKPSKFLSELRIFVKQTAKRSKLPNGR